MHNTTEFKKGDQVSFLDYINDVAGPTSHTATLIGRDTGDGLWAVDVDPPFTGHHCTSCHGPDSATIQHHFENRHHGSGWWLCEDEMTLLSTVEPSK